MATHAAEQVTTNAAGQVTTNAARQVAPSPGRPAVSAGVPILASKITAPGVPGWAVQRPRLTELIAGATRSCPMTVVTGPADAGKTMALALWAAAEPGAVAWVSLDDYDNQPGSSGPMSARHCAGAALGCRGRIMNSCRGSRWRWPARARR
jgi:hypothetical protein